MAQRLMPVACFGCRKAAAFDIAFDTAFDMKINTMGLKFGIHKPQNIELDLSRTVDSSRNAVRTWQPRQDVYPKQAIVHVVCLAMP